MSWLGGGDADRMNFSFPGGFSLLFGGFVRLFHGGGGKR